MWAGYASTRSYHHLKKTTHSEVLRITKHGPRAARDPCSVIPCLYHPRPCPWPTAPNARQHGTAVMRERDAQCELCSTSLSRGKNLIYSICQCRSCLSLLVLQRTIRNTGKVYFPKVFQPLCNVFVQCVA